ncbi:MAG: hypothetical protein ACRDRH_23305 [Pseudonocardia sp.]
MPVPNHPPATAELATLDAVSVIVDRSTDDGNRDHPLADERILPVPVLSC